MNPDPLDKFLNEPPNVPMPPELNEAIRIRTTALLRKPPRWRRWSLAAGLAAAVVIALVSAYVTWRPDPVEPAPQKELVEHKPEPAPPIPPREPQLVVSKRPIDLEWDAFDAPENNVRVRLYFQAGNLYLDSQKDFASAVRCYQQALHYCEAREREIDSNDNWLVMALKNDYRKEN